VSADLKYAGEQVAVASMNYKSERLQAHVGMRGRGGEGSIHIFFAASQLLARKQINLKLIPHVDGSPKIVQLVGISHEGTFLK